jgi:antitoxin FitA
MQAVIAPPGDDVASLTIRGLDEGLKSRLRIEAARQGYSMEEAARQILRRALMGPELKPGGLASRIHGYFVDAEEYDLEVPPRSLARSSPDFADPLE